MHITSKMKRYAIVMVIGVLMNEILSFAIAPLDLPLWLDMCGTALVAIILEPSAGIIVAFVNNFALSVFQYDASSIIYLGLGASVAIIAGTMLAKRKDRTFKRIVLVTVYIILITSFLTALLTMWRQGGISDLAWERHFFEMGVSMGMPDIIACGFGAFVVKIPDMCVSAVLVALVYRILPESLRYQEKN